MGSRGTSRRVSRSATRSRSRGRRVGLGGELRVLGGQLAGRHLVLAELEPLAVGGDDRAQLGMPLADPAGRRGIRVQRRIGHLLLKVGVLALKGEAVLEHRVAPLVRGSYLVSAFLPKRASNLATRPPVSRIFCLPV